MTTLFEKEPPDLKISGLIIMLLFVLISAVSIKTLSDTGTAQSIGSQGSVADYTFFDGGVADGGSGADFRTACCCGLVPPGGDHSVSSVGDSGLKTDYHPAISR